MLEQIQEIVRKNLPAEVGDQLKKHLQDAEATARRLQVSEDSLKHSQKQVEEKNARILELEGKLKVAGDLEKREKAVTDRENKIEVTLAEMRYHAAEGRAQAVYDLAALAFRSPRIMKTIREDDSVPMQTSPGSYPQTVLKTKTTTETKEQQ